MIAPLLGKLQGDGLAARARRGSILTMLQFGGSNVLRLISNLLLTRLLFPEAFGLMALVQVAMGAVVMFSDLGIRASVVQHARGDDPVFLNTAWTLQVFRGFFLYAVIASLSPVAAEFYGEPLLRDLLLVAGLSAVIQGFTPVRAMAAKRNLVLGRLTVIRLVTQVVSIIVTVILAWIFNSVWSLVFGNLVGTALGNLLIRRSIEGVPDRFALERAAVRDLLSFGAFVFLSSAATFVINNGDRAVLGKFIELDMLGVYTVAATLATVPVLMISALGTRIVFPLYSRRPPRDSAENRRKIFRARYVLTSSVFAGSAFLILFGNPVVRFLYDPRYEVAGAITVALTLGFLPMLIVASYDTVLLSNNRSDLHALLVVLNGMLRLGALYLGISTYGVLGAAMAPAIATLLYYPVMIAMTRRYRAWDPVHDMIFATLALGLYALAWWLDGALLMTVPRM